MGQRSAADVHLARLHIHVEELPQVPHVAHRAAVPVDLEDLIDNIPSAMMGVFSSMARRMESVILSA